MPPKTRPARPAPLPLGSAGSVDVMPISDEVQPDDAAQGLAARVDPVEGDASIVDVVPAHEGEDDCWVVSDSDSEAPADRAVPAVASVPVVRAAVHRAPAAPMQPRLPRRPPVFSAPRREVRGEWPRIIHDINAHGNKSYLRLSTTHGKDFQDMKAFCNVHVGCTAGRNCRDWRLIGRLWWWLSVAGDYPCKETHQAAIPTFADCCNARHEFGLISGTEDYFQVERPGVGEPADTW